MIGCRIEYCGITGIGGPPRQFGGWRNVEIVSRTLAYNGHYYQGRFYQGPYSDPRQEEQWPDRPDGFGIEESDGPILIKNTISMHNRGDGLDSKARNTTIEECIVANNWGTMLRSGVTVQR